MNYETEYLQAYIDILTQWSRGLTTRDQADGALWKLNDKYVTKVKNSILKHYIPMLSKEDPDCFWCRSHIFD